MYADCKSALTCCEISVGSRTLLSFVRVLNRAVKVTRNEDWIGRGSTAKAVASGIRLRASAIAHPLPGAPNERQGGKEKSVPGSVECDDPVIGQGLDFDE